MPKKKLRVKRQRIRVSRRDWDQAKRMTDKLLAEPTDSEGLYEEMIRGLRPESQR